MKDIVVFFKPDKKFGEFSNWYMRDFYIEGIKYCCMEQYLMAEKAQLFEDYDIYNQIMNTNNPKDIKALGRKVRNFVEYDWYLHRKNIIKKGLYFKFVQNKDLKKLLLDTGDKWIGECNKFDKVWGTGLTCNDMLNNEYDLNNLPGLNLLGRSLMDIRYRLKNTSKNETSTIYGVILKD